jgi:uracil-DNA glycosylase family 4
MPSPASNRPIDNLTGWWIAMGVDVDIPLVEALTRPENRREDSGSSDTGGRPSRPARRPRSVEEWVDLARETAAGCKDLEALAEAIRGYGGSPLHSGCEQAVVSDGVAGASLMIIGEGPGAEEDRKGKPFVGRAGQLLDRMLAAIGRRRAENAFISNVNYWRPPGNRNPEPDELAVCRPFVDRMIEIAKPKLIVAAGGVPSAALLDRRDGIMRLRGREFTYSTAGGFSVPLIPMLHPAYLLRRPQDKSRAWRDLLLIEQRLNTLET